MDYNLQGLSARSFEQLIQALATKYLGPQTVIFGDGPDGAREATFDGQTLYEGPGGIWNGYIVVQAKFRQAPKDDDAQWLIQQLTTEFKKFRERDLRRPDYYLLATNIKLSAVHRTGGKDKVSKALDKIKEDHKLKGFDVWDYDKIRAFLDDARDIATCYAAWISSGDVLASALSHFKASYPDFESTIANFLQKELISDQFARLEQAGHASAERVPLASVFVDLVAREDGRGSAFNDSNESENGFARHVMQIARERFDPESVGRYSSSEQLKQRKIPVNGRLVLVGGPGQGKSTVTQYICQLFRAAILNERPTHTVIPEARTAISLIEQQSKVEGLHLPGSRRFPVRVALNEFAAALSKQETGSLLDYIARRISKKTNSAVNSQALRSWFSSYPWFLVLDGLDEVPSSSNRDETIAAISDFLVDAAGCNADIVVLSTTRPQGYSKEFSPEYYAHWYLVPLSRQKALQYASRLVRMRYSENPDRSGVLLERLRAALTDRTTERLMRSPLQVTIMATLVGRMGKPPEEVWSLFREYYQVIYHREAEKASAHSHLLHEQRTNIDAIHNRVGLLLQVESELSGGSVAKLDLNRFTQLVADRLDEQGFTGKNKLNLQQAISKAAAERLVFISALEADQVGFDIRPLQEFFANEAMMSGTDNNLRVRLETIARLPYWRNVFIFSAGRCLAADRDYLWDSIHALCFELNSRNDRILHSAKAGSQLAIDLLADGLVRRHPKYCDSLLKLAFETLDLPTEDWHVRVAGLCTEDTEEVYVAEISQRLASSLPYSRSNAQLCLAELVERKDKWAAKKWRELKGATYFTSSDVVSLLTRVPSDYVVYSDIQDMGGSASVFEVRDALVESNSPPVRRRKNHTRPWARQLMATYFFDDPALFMAELRSIDNNSVHCGLALTALKNAPSLDLIPFRGGTWDVAKSVAEFCRTPTHLSLARALHAVGSGEPSDVQRWESWRLPWPLKACLRIAVNNRELLGLSKLAEAEELGTAGTWEKAEQRWLHKGVTGDDFIHSANLKDVPWDRQIDMLGFPCSGFETITFSTKPTTDYGHLKTLFYRLPASHASAIVASWALNEVRLAPIVESSTDVICDLILAQRRTGWPIDVTELADIFEKRSLDENCLEKLHELGRTASFFGDEASSEFTRRLQSAFIRNPKRSSGLLALIVAADDEVTVKDIPRSLLYEVETSNESLRADALRLALQQTTWTSEEAESCGRELAKAESQTGTAAVWSYLFARIAASVQMPAAIQEQIALSILSNATPGSSTEREAIRICNRILKQRHSGLDSWHTWQKLELPNGLYPLIHPRPT